jgi:hypothetical protein
MRGRGCSLGHARSVTAVAAGTPGHLGVTVRLPGSWSIRWRPCRACADPRGVFDAASYPLTPRRRRACDRLRRGEAAVSLSEVLPALLGSQAPPRSAFPPRPRRFRLGKLRGGDVTEGCTQPRTRLFRFRDGGRLLYAWAVFGPGAGRVIRRRVERVLSSIVVAPLPSR